MIYDAFISRIIPPPDDGTGEWTGPWELELAVPDLGDDALPLQTSYQAANALRPGEKVGLFRSKDGSPNVYYGAAMELLDALPDDVRAHPRLAEVFERHVGDMVVPLLPVLIAAELRALDAQAAAEGRS